MSAINTEWIDNLNARIEAVPDCAGLQALATEIALDYAKQRLAVSNQRSSIAPFLVDPSDLSKLITFCRALRSLYMTQDAQLALMEASLLSNEAASLALIANRISNLSCTFTPPSIG